MAKRRLRSETEDKRPEDQTPEERRALRKKQREREARGKKPRSAFSSPWRRAAVIGIPAAVVVAIAVLFLTQSVSAPCLVFSPIPSQSGTPAFPASNTTDFSQTWCPSGVNLLIHVHPYVQVSINGQLVSFPPSIGRSTNFTNYECDLPIHTHPASPGYPNGILHIESPWAYNYNLSTFFSVWQDSYVSAYINSSYSTRTIEYTSNDLLGLPVDATHPLTLFVDNQPSNAGPSLVLNTLDYLPSPYPSCMESRYGTGHTVLLSWHVASPAAIRSSLAAPVLTTAASDGYMATAYGSPAAKITYQVGQLDTLAHATAQSLLWLALRVV